MTIVFLIILMFPSNESIFCGFSGVNLCLCVSIIMVVVSPLTSVFLIVSPSLSRSRASVFRIMYRPIIVFELGYPLWLGFVPTPPYVGVCSELGSRGTFWYYGGVLFIPSVSFYVCRIQIFLVPFWITLWILVPLYVT